MNPIQLHLNLALHNRPKHVPYKPVKVQNVRARFRAESGFLDYDGVATNTMGLPDSIAMNVLPIVQVRFFLKKKIRG